MHPRIADYALIGDHQTAALVSNSARSTGCVCPGSARPRASPRCSATRRTGWHIAPRGADACTRRAYRHDTLVLDTEWETDEGTVRVTEEACELFERLVGPVNDVVLLAEEYDPATGRQLGHFPQTFSHVDLVGTALALFDGDQAG